MTTESQPLIDCRNVRKIFPDSAGVPFAAVDDVSFRLSAGEIVGLLGPDGAGKTTLIRLITGLMKPHGGSISVLNLDSVKKSRSIQASIGYMPQKFGLYEDLTVRENMELYARMHGVYGQDREKRFRSLLAMTSLERFTTRLAGKLSGGMKQKLGLCCSLVSSPPLILLDEPTVGVDPLSRRELWSILKQFSGEEGVGVLVSTSYMDESAYCNRTLIMYEGRLSRRRRRPGGRHVRDGAHAGGAACAPIPEQAGRRARHHQRHPAGEHRPHHRSPRPPRTEKAGGIPPRPRAAGLL